MKLAILGASGSIGQQAICLLKDKAQIKLIAGNNNIKSLQASIDLLKPEFALAHKSVYKQLKNCKVLPNEELKSALSELDLDGIINATSGFAGLQASLLAQEFGLKLYLANKESLVVAAHLLNTKVINPIDSEHSACVSLLSNVQHLKQIIITASGGAFKDLELERLASVKPEDALKHPNWAMGAKITIDSATMVNKLYELLEAKALFGGVSLDALIERSSIVHALIRTKDESVRAYMSVPDMRLAISSAIFKEADFASCAELELDKLLALKFERIDTKRYAMWELKDELLNRPELGVILNAADEVAVAAFLNHQCGFLDIHKLVFKAINHFAPNAKLEGTYEALLACDEAVRQYLLKELNA